MQFSPDPDAPSNSNNEQAEEVLDLRDDSKDNTQKSSQPPATPATVQNALKPSSIFNKNPQPPKSKRKTLQPPPGQSSLHFFLNRQPQPKGGDKGTAAKGQATLQQFAKYQDWAKGKEVTAEKTASDPNPEHAPTAKQGGKEASHTSPAKGSSAAALDKSPKGGRTTRSSAKKQAAASQQRELEDHESIEECSQRVSQAASQPNRKSQSSNKS